MSTNMFIAGKGFVYRFDPRAKTVAVLLLCILVFVPLSWIGLAVVLSFTMLLAIVSVGFKQAVKPLAMIAPLLAMMLVFVPLTYRDSQALLSIGPHMVASTESVMQFGRLAGRFITLTYLCTLYFWTTPMGTILTTLGWFGLPYRFSLVLTLTFRFVPFIAEAFKMISDSHALREANLGQKAAKKQHLKDAVPTVTAALVFALKAIPNLAMSLEHRGFGRTAPRSRFRRLPLQAALFTHMAISIIMPISCWLVFRI